jgi:hypothetical protein
MCTHPAEEATADHALALVGHADWRPGESVLAILGDSAVCQ